ncbi:MAG TPA: four helix bundle protein [Blastocatellia bacterium]|nr:four helix bundle protein [Blastocatellia bacterium]
MEGGLQELEEAMCWLELLVEAEILPKERLKPLCNETEELIAMFVTMVRNVKNKK